MSSTVTPKYVAPSREGKTLIGGHFDPEVKRALKTIAAQEDSSIQALLAEGIHRVIKDRPSVLDSLDPETRATVVKTIQDALDAPIND